jgi:Effector Associated Constant Component 1
VEAILSIRSNDSDAEGLQGLTEELCRDLNRETDVAAAVAAQPSRPGTKGDLLTVGTIIITLLGGRGVGRALVGVLNTYIGRSRHLEVEIKAEGGRAVKITGDNLTPDQLDQTIGLVNKVLGGSG